MVFRLWFANKWKDEWRYSPLWDMACLVFLSLPFFPFLFLSLPLFLSSLFSFFAIFSLFSLFSLFFLFSLFSLFSFLCFLFSLLFCLSSLLCLPSSLLVSSLPFSPLVFLLSLPSSLFPPPSSLFLSPFSCFYLSCLKRGKTIARCIQTNKSSGNLQTCFRWCPMILKICHHAGHRLFFWFPLHACNREPDKTSPIKLWCLTFWWTIHVGTCFKFLHAGMISNRNSTCLSHLISLNDIGFLANVLGVMGGNVLT